MSHKVAMTVTIQVRVPVPVGHTATGVVDFVRDCLSGGIDLQDALRLGVIDKPRLTRIDPNMLVVKLVKKETAYT